LALQGLIIANFQALVPDRSSATGARPAPENCSLSHADGGTGAIQIHWNHAGKDIISKTPNRTRTIMKKTATFIIVFLFALLLWNVFAFGFNGGDMHVNIDGDEFDGPLGALLSMLFAGGGTLLAVLVMAVVGVVLAVVFAGVGIILLGSLGIGAVVLALAISPLLLPLLLPLAVIWYLMKRSSKNRMVREQAV
jgi:hypothetical protein